MLRKMTGKLPHKKTPKVWKTTQSSLRAQLLSEHHHQKNSLLKNAADGREPFFFLVCDDRER